MFKIVIDYKEFCKWDKINGAEMDDRSASDIKLSKIINKEEITRLDILRAVEEMLYSNSRQNEENLFDGNEDYFIYSRLENYNSDELEEDEQEGYLSEYFIDVYRTEKLTCDMIH